MKTRTRPVESWKANLNGIKSHSQPVPCWPRKPLIKRARTTDAVGDKLKTLSVVSWNTSSADFYFVIELGVF